MAGPLNAFVEESYEDTLSLITELRDFLSEIQKEPAEGTDATQRTQIMAEISSITRHMTEAMAWLLLQKAAYAGEISSEDAKVRADGLLEAEDVISGPEPTATALPIELRGYIDRSRRLYSQIRSLRDATENASD